MCVRGSGDGVLWATEMLTHTNSGQLSFWITQNVNGEKYPRENLLDLVWLGVKREKRKTHFWLIDSRPD